jgi:hypothetical protein
MARRSLMPADLRFYLHGKSSSLWRYAVSETVQALAGWHVEQPLPTPLAWLVSVGATLVPKPDDGRIAVDANRKTSLDNVWAGGDCAAGGKDLTVTAVQDGKLAAQAIDHQRCMKRQGIEAAIERVGNAAGLEQLGRSRQFGRARVKRGGKGLIGIPAAEHGLLPTATRRG